MLRYRGCRVASVIPPAEVTERVSSSHLTCRVNSTVHRGHCTMQLRAQRQHSAGQSRRGGGGGQGRGGGSGEGGKGGGGGGGGGRQRRRAGAAAAVAVTMAARVAIAALEQGGAAFSYSSYTRTCSPG